MVWNPGQRLFGDRYIIERKLGEGGVGITYLAKNRRGELRVIKTLREQILNHPAWITKQDKLRQDFRDEALRLALCSHSHIVQVENVFDEGNLPCMAMEYIEGEDLGKQITETGALSEAEALLYIRQIGDALTVVHDRGLLHRDLKPSNIMMRAGKQEAVLIDFGIARQFIPGRVQQHTENLTPGYAPPEQYNPDAERGEYIDVYALAATLYALLTGQLPMPAPARLQNFTMRSPKDLNSSVSDRVNGAIMRGMALNYKFRPQSVQELLNLLGRIVPLTIPAALTLQLQSQTPNPPVVTPNKWECVHIISGISGEFAFSPKGDIFASVVSNCINFIEISTGKLIRTITAYSNQIHSVTLSPDRRILAINSEDNTINLWEVETGKEICTLTVDFVLDYCVAFSSDGRILVTCDRWHDLIKLWELATGTVIGTLYCGDSEWHGPIAFSSDGRLLATCNLDEDIKLWEVATGTKIRSFTNHFGSSIHALALNRDGQILAIGGYDDIKLWEVATGREIRSIESQFHSLDTLALSSDGQVLASRSWDKTIKLWEVATGREIHILSHFDGVMSVASSPHERWLAAGDASGNIKIWRSQLVVQ